MNFPTCPHVSDFFLFSARYLYLSYFLSYKPGHATIYLFISLLSPTFSHGLTSFNFLKHQFYTGIKLVFIFARGIFCLFLTSSFVMFIKNSFALFTHNLNHWVPSFLLFQFFSLFLVCFSSVALGLTRDWSPYRGHFPASLCRSRDNQNESCMCIHTDCNPSRNGGEVVWNSPAKMHAWLKQRRKQTRWQAGDTSQTSVRMRKKKLGAR